MVDYTSPAFNRHVTAWVILILTLSLLNINGYSQSGSSAKENEFYKIKKVPVPDNIILEVGGLTFDDNGRLAVCTRRGEIWIIENPASSRPSFKRFAHGLHEPLGLAYKEGAFLCAQRGELSKVTDTNEDDIADSYETVYSWPLAANYHEYSYGPLVLPDGDMIVSLNLGWTNRGESLSKWRGWMIKISPQGKMTPIATGMRSPAGFGVNAAGDLFYAENQGDWVGSGRMTHIEPGVFAGHPEGLKWSAEEGSPVKLKMSDIVDTLGYTLYEYSKKVEGLRPPSVWFPHTIMGISTSDILLINNNAFGPYEGQFLVGDQGHSKIMRVFQEKVNGAYQGVCFPFREGFSSGVLRLKWGPDNSLYVGMTNRGWSSTGKEPYGIERLIPAGKIPFEMKAVRAMPDGFEIEFTHPVNSSTALIPSAYTITDFTYKYHHIYGSPVINLEERKVTDVILSDDNRKARLKVEGLREGYIYEIKGQNLKSKTGEPLLHAVGYYTLNNIPAGSGKAMHEASHHNANAGIDLKSNKRITVMPSSWKNKADIAVSITTKPGLVFDVKEITVKAGSRVKLTFNNPDDMQHNLLIIKPGTIDDVAQRAIDLGLQGQEKGYVPVSGNVLFHTNLLQPHTSDIIFFEAPSQPGNYSYVCTYPGHASTMRGILKVIP